MESIALIACSRRKLAHRAKAQDLYQGERFRLACEFIERYEVDGAFVLSARYGLVGLNEVIQPYDTSLADMTTRERHEWARMISMDIIRKLPSGTHIIVLAEDLYAIPLRPYLLHAVYPLAGMNTEQQKAFLSS